MTIACPVGQTEDSVSWIDNKAASSEDDDAPTSSAKETDSPANNPFQASTAAILGETLMGSVENAALPGPPSKGEEGKLSSDVTSSGDSESSSEGSSDEGSSSEGDDPAPSLASSSGNGAEDRVDEAATRPGVSWEAEAEALSKKFRVRDSAQQTSNASTGEVGFLAMDQNTHFRVFAGIASPNGSNKPSGTRAWNPLNLIFYTHLQSILMQSTLFKLLQWSKLGSGFKNFTLQDLHCRQQQVIRQGRRQKDCQDN